MMKFCLKHVMVGFCALYGMVVPVKADSGITITTDDNYPPITSTLLEHGGLGLRIVTRAFEVADYPVAEILWQPWARGFQLTKLNAVDATFPWGRNAKREQSFLYSDPMVNMVTFAYVRKGAGIKIKQPKDLEGKRYCNPNGYGEYGAVKEYKEKGMLTRETPINMQMCFKMLNNARVDFVYSAPWEANFAIKEAGLKKEDFQREDWKLTDTPLSLIVSRQNPRGDKIITAFNKGLAHLRESGELEEIYQQFDFMEYLPNP